jgi:hypothetical protein
MTSKESLFEFSNCEQNVCDDVSCLSHADGVACEGDGGGMGVFAYRKWRKEGVTVPRFVLRSLALFGFDSSFAASTHPPVQIN